MAKRKAAVRKTSKVAVPTSGTQVADGARVEVDPNAIVMDPKKNGRAFEEPVGDLVDSIKREGLLQPVVLRSVAKGKFEVVAGYRRVRALREINASRKRGKLSCVGVVREVKSEDEAIAINVAENQQRRGLSPIDQAHACRLMDECGMPHRRIGQVMGRSPAWVTQTLKLNDLADDVKQRVHNGEIAVRAAYDLAELPESKQESLVKERAKNLDKIGEAIKDEGKPDKGEAPKKERGTKGAGGFSDLKRAARTAGGKQSLPSTPSARKIAEWVREVSRIESGHNRPLSFARILAMLMLDWINRGDDPDRVLYPFLDEASVMLDGKIEEIVEQLQPGAKKRIERMMKELAPKGKAA